MAVLLVMTILMLQIVVMQKKVELIVKLIKELIVFMISMELMMQLVDMAMHTCTQCILAQFTLALNAQYKMHTCT